MLIMVIFDLCFYVTITINNVLVIYCCIKNYHTTKWLNTTYIYCPTVSVGQRFRHDLVVSSASGCVTGCDEGVAEAGVSSESLTGEGFSFTLTWLWSGFNSSCAVGLMTSVLCQLLVSCWFPSLLATRASPT